MLFLAMGKKLTPETEGRIHGTGMMVLMSLIALITFIDIRRFF
jgi:membrane-associated protease RseP (regulator of RpoE activity)